MRTTSFTTTVAGRKVKATLELPVTATEWLATSGYTDEQLARLIFHGWKVEEVQPEIREAKCKSATAATKVASERFTAGLRGRKATPHEQKLLDAGHTLDQIELYQKMQKIAKAK